MRMLGRSRPGRCGITIRDVDGKPPVATPAAPHPHELARLNLARQLRIRCDAIPALHDCQIPCCTNRNLLYIEVVPESRQLPHQVAIEGPDSCRTNKRG